MSLDRARPRPDSAHVEFKFDRETLTKREAIGQAEGLLHGLGRFSDSTEVARFMARPIHAMANSGSTSTAFA